MDAVVVYYDLYGQGVYTAITENANFSGDNALPMASVDIDPVDITNIPERTLRRLYSEPGRPPKKHCKKDKDLRPCPLYGGRPEDLMKQK